MRAVRFTCAGASAAEQVELEKKLAALDGTEILESGESGGAAFAEVIIVVLIEVGGPILHDAVKAFGKWLLSRRSRGGQAIDGPVRVTVEGIRGSCTITITPETDTAQLDLAALGTITDIREAE